MTKELNPRYYYDCGHCKFNWCCGELCACLPYGLPKAPAYRNRQVAALQAFWRKHHGTKKYKHEDFTKMCLRARTKWYKKA